MPHLNYAEQEGPQCVFPFNWAGREFSSCNTMDGDTAWCATETQPDSNNMTRWGYCGPSCSSRLTRPQPHALNRAGSCVCGVPNTPIQRIVGGTEAAIGEFPWQVTNYRHILQNGCSALVCDQILFVSH